MRQLVPAVTHPHLYPCEGSTGGRLTGRCSLLGTRCTCPTYSHQSFPRQAPARPADPPVPGSPLTYMARPRPEREHSARLPLSWRYCCCRPSGHPSQSLPSERTPLADMTRRTCRGGGGSAHAQLGQGEGLTLTVGYAMWGVWGWGHYGVWGGGGTSQHTHTHGLAHRQKVVVVAKRAGGPPHVLTWSTWSGLSRSKPSATAGARGAGAAWQAPPKAWRAGLQPLPHAPPAPEALTAAQLGLCTPTSAAVAGTLLGCELGRGLLAPRGACSARHCAGSC